ncbi:MAG: hypothetical protein GEV05_20335 [Betaproteobacteria bacterium]|nr:hypothetical protein [Betaproteobacteria bacterium]
MNLVLGMLAGALIGWLACALFRLNTHRGLWTSVFLGFVGGGVGMQLASMMSVAPGADGAPNIFALVMAAATAGACLIVASMVASR